MKLEQLEQFIERASDEAGGYPCRYGHLGCSDRSGGRCWEELWSQQCSDETDEEYENRLANG